MDVVEQIKAKLLGKYKSAADIELIATSMLYLQKKIAEKQKVEEFVNGKKIEKWVAKYHFDAGWLLQTVAECIDTGFALDGVNYVITGNKMTMPTYKAFKNKLYMVYPETVIDLQLIREGDTYEFAKESGSVLYTHNIADPFGATEGKILGAYCVIKNSRGEFLETLNSTDYAKMRDAGKSPATWRKWESEFYLKSVIKRACKRHFNDITKVIEEKDNEAVGLAELVKATPDEKAAIIAANQPADIS